MKNFTMSCYSVRKNEDRNDHYKKDKISQLNRWKKNKLNIKRENFISLYKPSSESWAMWVLEI